MSYEFALSCASINFDWMLETMKLNSESSPSSALETLSALSGSPSHKLSLEIDSSFPKSPMAVKESVHVCFSKRSFPCDGGCSTKHDQQHLVSSPNIVGTSKRGLDESQQAYATVQQSRLADHVSDREIQVVHPQSSMVCKDWKLISRPQLDKRQKVIDPLSQNLSWVDVERLLIECARAISENRMGDFEELLKASRSCVSISGEPIQRLGAYMLEGLVARQESSGTNIYETLRSRLPLSKDLLSYMRILCDICPFLKFGIMAANGAIAEAIRNEDQIHIIDFQIAQGSQWATLLQALAARPGGPPHVRITGIDDPLSKYARGEGLEVVGKRFAALSERFHIPVEFHPVPVFGPDVTREMLEIRPGEAIVVNFTLQLHHTPDESVDVVNRRDGLLRMVKSLSPKVTTLVEQESNTNTAPFVTRFMEALNYYHAIFESIDTKMPRDSKQRINVEQHCLARDIVNIIACEGKERVKRHELLGKWKSRLCMAGFRPCPLSSYVNSVIKILLSFYSENYTLTEMDGAILLGWKDRHLISVSAWY